MNCYELPKGISVYSVNGKKVVINSEVPSWIVTNDIGEMILELFDGKQTISEITDFCSNALGEEFRERIEKFCTLAVESKIFDSASDAVRHRQILTQVHLSLSEKCNLKCKYCYAEKRKEKEKKLSLEEYKKIIDGVYSINPHCAFTLTGGEPLLNPLWKDIALYIKEKGMETWLLSNGTLFSEQNIDDICRLFDHIKISVDGSSAEIHERTRGNNYNKIEFAIALLESRKKDYLLSMTVSKTNIDDIENAARKYGNRLSFAPLFPDERTSDIQISGLEYFNALNKADKVVPLSYCEQALDSSRINRCYKCAMGEGEISISPTGDVYPCQLLHFQEFNAGNVHDAPVEYIYKNSEILKNCRNLSVDKIEGCKTCAVKYICGGACRARAFYECGDIKKNGDFCIYEKKSYIEGIANLYDKNALSSI